MPLKTFCMPTLLLFVVAASSVFQSRGNDVSQLSDDIDWRARNANLMQNMLDADGQVSADRISELRKKAEQSEKMCVENCKALREEMARGTITDEDHKQQLREALRKLVIEAFLTRHDLHFLEIYDLGLKTQKMSLNLSKRESGSAKIITERVQGLTPPELKLSTSKPVENTGVTIDSGGSEMLDTLSRVRVLFPLGDPAKTPDGANANHVYTISVEGTKGVKLRMLLVSKASATTVPKRQSKTITIPFETTFTASSYYVWFDSLNNAANAGVEGRVTGSIKIDGERQGGGFGGTIKEGNKKTFSFGNL